MLVINAKSPEETFTIGKKVGAQLSAGQVVCLEGDLGAGKTLFVQGIADALHVTDDVTSPTFSVLNVYQADLPIYHFDLYRLEHADELFDIGFFEYTNADGIAIIEWSDKFSSQLPEEYLKVQIRLGDLITERVLYIEANGRTYDLVCKELIE